jgi:hypothetical protein
LRATGGGVHPVVTVKSSGPIATRAAGPEEDAAVAAVAAILPGRRAATAGSAVADQECITTASAVGAVASATPKESTTSTVTRGTDTVGSGIDAVPE